MGGVSDAEQAGEMPAFESVDLNGEELDLIPVCDLVHAVGEEGDDADDDSRKASRPSGWMWVVKESFAMMKPHW